MTEHPTARPTAHPTTGASPPGRWTRPGGPAGPLAAAVLLVALVCGLGPWWSVFQFDPDEGLSLIKAALMAEGWLPYRDVWNDQPPFLMLVQAGVFGVLGPGVVTGRAVVLLFAALGVACLFRILRRQAGPVAAWAGVALLVTGGLYLRLSVSSMIGLPAVALAIAAMDQADAIEGPADRRRLYAAAALTGLSLATKLFTAPMAVGIGVMVLVRTWRRDDLAATARACVQWGAASWALLLAILAPFGANVVEQLFHSHVAARASDAFRHLGGPYHLWVLVKESPQYPVLGAVGLAVTLAAAPALRRHLVAPVAWLALGALALVYHQPIWYHHLLLLHVPLAWLAGLGAGAARAAIGRRPVSRLGVAARWAPPLVMVAAAALGVPAAAAQVAKVARDFAAPPAEADVKAVESLLAFKDRTRWVLTDYPMDVLRAGLLSVPPAAVYPSKRIKSGNLSQAAILGYIRAFRPEQVSYRRFFMGKEVKAFLDAHYVRRRDNPEQLHYVRPDLLEPAPPRRNAENR